METDYDTGQLRYIKSPVFDRSCTFFSDTSEHLYIHGLNCIEDPPHPNIIPKKQPLNYMRTRYAVIRPDNLTSIENSLQGDLPELSFLLPFFL